MSEKASKFIRVYNTKVIVTVITTLVLVFSSLFVSYKVRQIEEETAWFAIERTVNRVDEELVRRIEIDREVLRVLADLIATEDDVEGPEVQRIIDNFRSNTLMDRVNILLPGDRLVRAQSGIMSVAGKISYEQELVLGEHISDREVSAIDGKSLVLRNFVPIKKNGETVAMLYGIIRLDRLPVFYNTSSYEGTASYLIIDSDSGDYILDSRKDKLDNMWVTALRKLKGETDYTEFIGMVANRKHGRTVMYSEYSKENVCVVYKPSGINEWEICVSVPERIAKRRVTEVYNVLFWFLLVQFIFLGGYFIWINRQFLVSLKEAQRAAERDALTGLRNRNCYERELAIYPKKARKCLSSAYIDVNGLHELNNTEGHAKGDEMLKAVAAIIKSQFGDHDSYRIGGDEFVAFAVDQPDGYVLTKLQFIKQEAAKAGYHVSTGCCRVEVPFDIQDIIKKAEQGMYEEKRAFYNQNGNDRRVR